MTDNEIIKALECCTDEGVRCDECPCQSFKYSECYELITREALDLINRQKAEIERLKAELKEDSRVMKQALVLVDEIKKEIAVDIETAKAEAVKEFADELIKRYSTELEGYYGEIVWVDDIDELVKEMAGDKDES